MILKRLFPSRWARITIWTGAAVAWGTSVVAVAASVQPDATPTEPAEGASEASVEEVSPTTTTATTPLPAAPRDGLVVIRYVPVPLPPPQTIVRTVTVQESAGSGSAAPPAKGVTPSSPAKSPATAKTPPATTVAPAPASTPTTVAPPPPPPPPPSPPTTVPSQGS